VYHTSYHMHVLDLSALFDKSHRPIRPCRWQRRQTLPTSTEKISRSCHEDKVCDYHEAEPLSPLSKPNLVLCRIFHKPRRIYECAHKSFGFVSSCSQQGFLWTLYIFDTDRLVLKGPNNSRMDTSYRVYGRFDILKGAFRA
jgi:hypothetical protein